MAGLWLSLRVQAASLIVDVAEVASWLGMKNVTAVLCRGARTIVPESRWRQCRSQDGGVLRLRTVPNLTFGGVGFGRRPRPKFKYIVAFDVLAF